MDPAAHDGEKPNGEKPKRPDALTRFRQRLLARVSIRQRLALWYATLLTLVLVLFSVIVYTVAQNQLQTSVNEEIRSRAVYIAGALQGAQDSVGQPAAAATATPSVTVAPSPSAAASPTSTGTQTASPGTTPNATVTEPTPIPTVDPKSSQNIQNQLNKAPSVLGRIDFAVEVLDVKLNPKYRLACAPRLASEPATQQLRHRPGVAGNAWDVYHAFHIPWQYTVVAGHLRPAHHDLLGKQCETTWHIDCGKRHSQPDWYDRAHGDDSAERRLARDYRCGVGRQAARRRE